MEGECMTEMVDLGIQYEMAMTKTVQVEVWHGLQRWVRESGS